MVPQWAADPRPGYQLLLACVRISMSIRLDWQLELQICALSRCCTLFNRANQWQSLHFLQSQACVAGLA